MTSRVVVALVASMFVGCSQSNPVAPTDVAREQGTMPAVTPNTTPPQAFVALRHETLASVPLERTFGVNGVGVQSAQLYFGFADLPIFEVVLRGNTHRMLVAVHGATPNFDTIVARLTDDVDDVMSFRTLLLPNGIGDSPSSTIPESELLPGVDLQGVSINRIRLKIDEFDIVSPGSDPNQDGIWTDFHLAATLFIE